MANKKGLGMQQTIKTLHERGRSIRFIARELGISRNTVRGYVRSGQTDPPDAKVLTGSAAETDPPDAMVLTGSAAETDPPDTKVLTGSKRSQSLCLSHHVTIEKALDRGLSAQRIYQDLSADYGFSGSYSSVQRYIKRLCDLAPVPFRRMECEPGEEAQVDFGQGAWIIDEEGRRRRPSVLRVVLSYSRKGYSEAVYRQNTESFIRALENAFRHFGGVPSKTVIDNLKAAVIKADWYDPEIHPKVRSFSAHYNTVILPTKPRMPRHKGKVERGVDYVQENALKGRTFSSLEEQNAYLQDWERNVADTRIHGTTRVQVREAFEAEKPALQALPPTLFPCFEEAKRTGHNDGHVEVAKAYYSVPPEFLRRQVWVRWDSRVVRIYHPVTFQQIRMHGRQMPGKFSTNEADIPAKKINSLERGEHYLLKRLGMIGDNARLWGSAMLKARGIAGIRVLQGILNLNRKYPAHVLDHACAEAVKLGAYRLHEIRALSDSAKDLQQPELALQQQHELIRPLDQYSLWPRTNEQGIAE
jgi:transposase